MAWRMARSLGPAAPVNRVLSYPRGTVRSMPNPTRHQPAATPDDLGRMFLERANARDVDGLVALYEPEAVLAFASGDVASGHAEIRAVYADLLADAPHFEPGSRRSAMISVDLALTSTRLAAGGVTVEIAHRQPDGTWLWAIDQPNIVG